MKTTELLHTTVSAWQQAMVEAQAGLDLSDAEDRIAFRLRLAAHTKGVRTSLIRSLAQAAGARGVPTSHAGATRALAEAWIEATR